MSRGDLSEAEWRLLKDLLPAERDVVPAMIRGAIAMRLRRSIAAASRPIPMLTERER